MGGDLEDDKPPCPDCKGTGEVLLLVSKARCDKCRGTGVCHSLDDDDGPEDFDDYDPSDTGLWSIGYFFED